MTDATLKFECGTYKVIGIDGSEQLITAMPNLLAISRHIDAECWDTVPLTVVLARRGITPDLVMIVDDNGLIDGRPINSKATELYRNVCKPGETGTIHGPVVIVHDVDFR